MKNPTCRLACTMIVLVLTTSRSLAQSTYEPYAFTTLAGNAGLEGPESFGRFNVPSGVALDSAGNFYLADRGNHTIRKVTPAGVVTTLVGLADSIGSTEGTGRAPRFYLPCGVCVDSAGNIYVADTLNGTIRKVTPAAVVTTLAGLAGSDGGQDGTGSAARFSSPFGVAVDSAGNLYVADTGNNTIRKGYSAAATGIHLSGPRLGFDGGHFGFNLTGPSGRLVVVESSTGLVKWLPIWTNTFAGDLIFCDPQTGVSATRFYRARLP
ncbi:MAG: hypothetical protein ABI651_00025 [Verrucomicrobiota bacterium]